MRHAAFAFLLLLAVPAPADAQTVDRSTSYFTFGGRTLEAIEAELDRRGPAVGAAGVRHPGATRMQFFNKVTYARTSASCQIEKAAVKLDVKVILPRWTGRRGAAQDVAIVWDTLAADIKRHEERHVEIARNHARELQDALGALKPRKTCDTLKADVASTTARILKKHDLAQDRIDRIEGLNFASRFQRPVSILCG